MHNLSPNVPPTSDEDNEDESIFEDCNIIESSRACIDQRHRQPHATKDSSLEVRNHMTQGTDWAGRGTLKLTLGSPGLEYHNYSAAHPSSTLAHPADAKRSGFRSEGLSP